MSRSTLRTKLPLSVIIFLIYAAIGLFTVRDYGITWDEPENFAAGRRNVGLLVRRDLPLPIPFRDDRTLERYPPFVSMLSSISSLLFAERFKLMHPVTAHHAAVVVVSALGVFAVFELTRRLTKSAPAALVSAAALGFHPHFFGHMHNNVKDAPATGLIAVTLLLLTIAAKKMRPAWFLAAGVATGAAIGAKFTGVLLLPIGLVVTYLAGKKRWYNFLIFAIGALVTLPVSWPWLAADPIARIPLIVRYVAEVGRGLPVLFLGTYYDAGTTVPWYYAPVMVILTTPIPILLLAAVGLVKMRKAWIVLLWGMVSVGRMIVPGQVVYNGIRQGMDVFVPLAVLAGLGWTVLAEKKALVAYVFVVILVGHLAWITFTFHPYQAVYYNRLAGEFTTVPERFDFDYWGFSLLEMVRYVNTVGHSGEVIDTNWIDYKKEYVPGNTLRIDNDAPDRSYVLLPHSNNYFSGAFQYWREHGELIYAVKRNGADVGYVFHVK